MQHPNQQRAQENKPPHGNTQGSEMGSELHWTENQFRTFFDLSPIGKLITATDGRILKANQAFATMLGYASNQIASKSFASFTHPDDISSSYEHVARLVAGESEVAEFEKRYLHRDGHVVWASLTVRLARDPNGKPLHFLTHIQDVSQRKQAEAAAQAAEDRLLRQRNALVSLAGVSIPSVDDGESAIRRITEASARTLNTARVSLWRYNEDRSAIRCVDLFELDGGRHSAGAELAATAYPSYFKALLDTDIIAADDANRDPRTCEFSEGYLRPLGITSMMDAPVRIGGTMVGVLCHEHIGPARVWTADERTFAAAISNLVSLALEEAERRSAQQALDAKEATVLLQSAALSAAASAVVITNRDGTIAWTNPAFTTLTGYELAEVVGKNPRDLIKSGVHDRAFYQELWNTLLGGSVWRGEMTNRRKDGSLYPEGQTITPVRAAGSEISHFIAIKHDLTEEKKKDQALRESEERFRQMAENIQEAFFQLDIGPEGPIPVFISPIWAEIWGRPLADAYSKLSVWLESVHAEDRPRMAAVFQRNMEGQASVDTFRVVRPDGAIRWVRGRATPIKDSAGRVYRLVGIAEDITSLRVAEEQAIQAQRMEAVGRLAGGVAHDFNNLLTVILGEVELTLTDPGQAPTPPVIASLQEIKKAGERAANLTRQLLAFSRRQLIEPIVFDVNGLVGDMEKMLRRLIGEDLDLTASLSRIPSTIRADRGQIEQVVANLVVNARDAMPRGGSLTISVEDAELDEAYASNHAEVEPGPYVLIRVKDTGTGMTDEVKSKIFEPFFTTKEKGKGTGLGLATSFGIVRQSGGHIAVDSTVGQGTTFKVYLPRVDSAGAADAGSVLGSVPRGNEMILVVEDEAAVRQVVVRGLESQGYRVLQARDAEQALNVLGTQGRDVKLLFTDVVLPGAGGRELADQVKVLRPDIKVLFATGYTDDVILQHRLLEQGVKVLQKPFNRETLAHKVREVLDGD